MGLMNRKLLRALVLVVSVLFGVVADARPAAAALPWLHCRDVQGWQSLGWFGYASGPMNLCVSNINGYQQAGLGLDAPSFFLTKDGNEVRLELSYFAFDQFPYGSAWVQPSHGSFRGRLSGPVTIQTDPVAWWVEGVFCARLYNLTTKVAIDMVCVDTNGNSR